MNGTRVCGYGPGGSFGELALMYNCERAATVKATSDSRLWTMDLSTFRRSLATTASSQILSRCEFLRKVPFLAELNNEQVGPEGGRRGIDEAKPFPTWCCSKEDR